MKKSIFTDEQIAFVHLVRSHRHENVKMGVMRALRHRSVTHSSFGQSR